MNYDSVLNKASNLLSHFEVRNPRLDSELLLLMRKAGCVLTAFGVESANEKVLTNVNRRFKKCII